MFSNCFGGILELSVHRFEAEGNFVTVKACLLCCCVEPLLLLTEERFWTKETVVLHASESTTFLRVQLIDLNHDGVLRGRREWRTPPKVEELDDDHFY